VVLHCRREVIDRVIHEELGTDLAGLEKQIDAGPQPHSRELKVGGSWPRARRAGARRDQECRGRPGGKGTAARPRDDRRRRPLRHLGYGGRGSLAQQKEAIHFGADDNASGVAVLLEIARRLRTTESIASPRGLRWRSPARNAGCSGADHYAAHAPFSLKDTIAMLNFDMVGEK